MVIFSSVTACVHPSLLKKVSVYQARRCGPDTEAYQNQQASYQLPVDVAFFSDLEKRTGARCFESSAVEDDQRSFENYSGEWKIWKISGNWDSVTSAYSILSSLDVSVTSEDLQQSVKKNCRLEQHEGSNLHVSCLVQKGEEIFQNDNTRNNTHEYENTDQFKVVLESTKDTLGTQMEIASKSGLELVEKPSEETPTNTEEEELMTVDRDIDKDVIESPSIFKGKKPKRIQLKQGISRQKSQINQKKYNIIKEKNTKIEYPKSLFRKSKKQRSANRSESVISMIRAYKVPTQGLASPQNKPALHPDDAKQNYQLCGLETKNKNVLQKHTASHSSCKTSKNELWCLICDTVFKCHEDFTKHWTLHLEEGCPSCSFQTRYTKSLKAHFQRAHSLRPHKCSKCEKGFATTSDLKAHMKTHETKYVCNICDKKYAHPTFFQRHLNRHENTYIAPEFPCPKCGKIFRSLQTKQEHIKYQHEGAPKPYLCSDCGKSFTQKIHLVEHQYQHLDIRPYRCEICGKSFNQKSSIHAHMRAHKNLPCNHRCPHCDKAFYTRGKLNAHLVMHTKEPRFKCDVCSKTFPRNTSFKRHYRIHNNERPFPCPLENCKSSFRDSFNLKRHLTDVHKIKNPGTVSQTSLPSMKKLLNEAHVILNIEEKYRNTKSNLMTLNSLKLNQNKNYAMLQTGEKQIEDQTKLAIISHTGTNEPDNSKAVPLSSKPCTSTSSQISDLLSVVHDAIIDAEQYKTNSSFTSNTNIYYGFSNK